MCACVCLRVILSLSLSLSRCFVSVRASVRCVCARAVSPTLCLPLCLCLCLCPFLSVSLDLAAPIEARVSVCLCLCLCLLFLSLSLFLSLCLSLSLSLSLLLPGWLQLTNRAPCCHSPTLPPLTNNCVIEQLCHCPFAVSWPHPHVRTAAGVGGTESSSTTATRRGASRGHHTGLHPCSACCQPQLPAPQHTALNPTTCSHRDTRALLDNTTRHLVAGACPTLCGLTQCRCYNCGRPCGEC